jgi:chemosensory pili system protein ChpA (sensor histidine kinase/response regulator)
MSTSPDPTLLSWVKTEIDFSLGVVRESIAKAQADASDGKALSVCPHQLHQVTGALRMVGLHGARQFCEAIEGAFTSTLKTVPAKKTLSTLDQSVLALKEFVDNLADGGANVPVKLFPIYRELRALQGKADTSEKELFYPELTLLPPTHPEHMTIAADAIAEYAQAQRTRFQRGLVAWMHKPDDARGLREMLQAVDAMDRISAQLPEPHTLWWIAPALIEGLIQPPSPQWLHSVRPLCSRIDFEMRDIARQSGKSNEPLVRDLLYAVATCAPVTDRIKAVKAHFALDQLLPEPEVSVDFDMDWLQPALADVRSRLEAAKSAWLEYVSGASQKLQRFREVVRALKARADELGSHELVRLFDVIALVATRLPDPYPPDSQSVMLEMATSFLLAESVVDGFSHPPADLQQQIVLINGWLLDAASGKSTSVPPAGLRPDLVQQFNEAQLRNQVAKEILNNLQEIEQAADTYARDPNQPDALAPLYPKLRQIHGAFALLGMGRGLEVLSYVQELVDRLAAPDAAYNAEDMDWIAEGVSSLGMFLEPCMRGRAPDASALDRFLDRVAHRAPRPVEATVELAPQLATGDAAAVHQDEPDLLALDTESVDVPLDINAGGSTAPSEVSDTLTLGSKDAAPTPGAPARPVPEGVSEELLDIFLEEADEVLSNIGAALPQCETQPNNFDALTVIRRGFHTLKGSGRMVGLTELGEVAWAIEQVMNRWLESRQPATPILLELIRMGTAGFARWLEALKARTPFAADADSILTLARRLKSGDADHAKEPSAPVPPSMSELPPVASAEPLESASRALLSLPEEEGLAPAVALDLQPPTLSTAETEPHVEAAPAQPDTPNADYSGLNLDFELLEPEAAAETKPEEPAPQEVVFGAARMPTALYEVYVKEAEGHAQTLHREFDAWRAHTEREPSSQFHRAAHTLASVSRTAGVEALADLAAALEHWLPTAQHTTAGEDADLVREVNRTLTEMVAMIARREAPAPAPDMVAALQALTTRSHGAPALPHSTEDSVIIRATAEVRAEQRAIHDDIDPQLLPIFLEEAQELLPLIGGDLREWKAKPAEPKFLQSLKRTLHTLKGSARMAGAMRLGELTHLMESRVEAAQASGLPTAETISELESQMDRLSAGIEHLRETGGIASAPAEPAVAVPEAAPAGPAPLPAQAVAATPVTASAARAVPLPAPATLLRINAETLDRLINQAGEASIARARIEGEIRTFTTSVSDLSESVGRLRTQLRDLEIQADSQTQSRLSVIAEGRPDFDPLEFDRYTRLQELTRMMAETIHDALTIQQTLVRSLDETDAALLLQSRIHRELQQELMRLRTVPFSSIVERLHRVVRLSARELGKRANLEIRGEQVELDRSVLERVGAPLEHLLRNAVAHGIELPETRAASGKAETGEINLTLRQESDDVVIVVSDDGTGLDLQKLRQKGIEKGLLPTDREPDTAEIQQVMFAPGISTADAVTETAGRGIGMDVVLNEVSAVGGRIEIDTKPGSGTTFTIYLPLTLAVAQAVLVRSAEQLFAVSSALVSRVLRLKPQGVAELYARGAADADGHSYPIHYLGRLLGSSEPAPTEGYTPVLLLRSGNQRIALHVDELIKNQEVVIKNIGPQLARLPWMTGATVLGDGRIVLMINPVQLAQQVRAATQAPTVPQKTQAALPAEHTVMVVDDSLTVRKITSRLLEREGYRVVAAKDGVDALEQMNRTLPDVMLVDIEMPRMDGFDLTRNVRADPKTATTPIIVISSRTADKHRNHAFELGVNGFLGKPYEETELLSQIRRCLEKDPQHVH